MTSCCSTVLEMLKNSILLLKWYWVGGVCDHIKAFGSFISLTSKKTKSVEGGDQHKHTDENTEYIDILQMNQTMSQSASILFHFTSKGCPQTEMYTVHTTYKLYMYY